MPLGTRLVVNRFPIKVWAQICCIISGVLCLDNERRHADRADSLISDGRNFATVEAMQSHGDSHQPQLAAQIRPSGTQLLRREGPKKSTAREVVQGFEAQRPTEAAGHGLHGRELVKVALSSHADGVVADDCLGDCIDKRRVQRVHASSGGIRSPARSPQNPPASLSAQMPEVPDSKVIKVVATSDMNLPLQNHCQVMSLGDVQAITVDGDTIYAVGFYPGLAVLHQGIYKQELSEMTPYSAWLLIGYGSMKSIAVHNSDKGKIMYSVGQDNFLYNQDIAIMPNTSQWTLASIFPLSTIAISGDTIYGVSPDHPNKMYKRDLLSPKLMDQNWQQIETGTIKSLTVASGMVFALMDDGLIYNKFLNVPSDFYLNTDWSQQVESPGLLSVAALGDTIYGVTAGHKVCRRPAIVNKEWKKSGKWNMRSVAIDSSSGTIYGAGIDGLVYKQDLATMGVFTEWGTAGFGSNGSIPAFDPANLPYPGRMAAEAPVMLSIAIQGKTIYGVGEDKFVYKQELSHMNPKSSWENASKCCILEIALADGIIYGVGPDHIVYKQADVLMSPDTEWIPASKAGVFSIAVRGDTIYGIGLDKAMYTQTLTHMTLDSLWAPSSTDGSLYPSRYYTSIMAHNDVMYACAEDHAVYTKLIDEPIRYPPGLKGQGNTHQEAFEHNLTDLTYRGRRARFSSGPVPISTTPEWDRTTGSASSAASSSEGNSTAFAHASEAAHQLAAAESESVPPSAAEPKKFIKDCFGDSKQEGCAGGAKEGDVNTLSTTPTWTQWLNGNLDDAAESFGFGQH